MNLLLVSVGRRQYAVAADAVERIVDPALEPEFHREPQAREATHRGERYPVVDLHDMSGERRGDRCVYLFLAAGGRRAVVPVDGAEAIRDVPAAAIAPLPSYIFTCDRRPFRGIFSDGRRARLLLDEGALP
ncbi:MAG: chemotaxis protein CheW [Acidobacteriota bacterium]